MTILLRILLGLSLIALVIWLRGGIGDLSGALTSAGWVGVAAVTVYHAIPMATCGLAWLYLLPHPPPGSLGSFVFARWVRDAVNQLLPFMPLGGEVIGARLLARGGVAGTMAASLTVVDVTAEVMSQVAFSLIGLGLFALDHSLDSLMGEAAIGVALCVPMLGGLLLAQRLGLVRVMERIADKVMPDAWRAMDLAAGIHDGMVALYAHRGRFWGAVAIHLLGWLVACGEAWLALRLMGHPLSITEVVTLESVIYAVRNAAFLVPGALGVQESAYVLVGALFGLPAETALAVSLIKRGRELCLGAPALLAWQWTGRRKETGAAG
jgi:putative membrane protein